jgi:nifR3 family TIM-barrel protein
MLRYGALVFDPPLVLAPMAGITDAQFRRVLRRIGGVGLVTMEFISSEALVRGNRRTRTLMRFVPEERPISIQIYGRDPAHMAEAARVVEEIGADACDINMGCPANKVLKGCAGCALMGDLGLAREIVREARRAIAIPLTVKFRLGLRDDHETFLELGRICQGEGADGVALHARTAAQMFGGRARWDDIARLKAELSIPVVGNGDVQTAADVVRMLGETGCDGVMIGRASMKNPWIYRQAADLLAGRTPYEPTLLDRRDVIRSHFDLVVAEEEPSFALHKLRTFTGWYTHGLPEGKHLRARIGELGTPQAFLDAVESFFAGAMRTAA